MDQTLLAISLGLFLTVVVAAVGFYMAFGDGEARRLRRRLRDLAPVQQNPAATVNPLLRDARFSGIRWLDALLNQMPLARRIQLLLVQGDVKMKAGPFLLLIAVLAAVGVVAASTFRVSAFFAPLGLLLGVAPIVWAQQKKVRRVRSFERQFPDALDILTSALQSGMAFSGAVQVVSEECGDPVAKEFTILFEENRLGVDMKVALRHLAERVDSKELHLFVIAVLLQRDTGGNLVEILENTAFVIRERLRILGDVRALTAQARLSGLILSILPIAVGVFIIVTAPDYMRVLFKEPLGRQLLFTAIALQVIGYLFMRRIADIKV